MNVSRLTDLAECLDVGEHPFYNEDDGAYRHDALSYLPQLPDQFPYKWRTIPEPGSNKSLLREVAPYFDISEKDVRKLFFAVPNLNNHRGTAGARAMAKIIYDYVSENLPDTPACDMPRIVEAPTLHDRYAMAALAAMISKLPYINGYADPPRLTVDAKKSVGTAFAYADEAMKQRAARG